MCDWDRVCTAVYGTDTIYHLNSRITKGDIPLPPDDKQRLPAD